MMKAFYQTKITQLQEKLKANQTRSDRFSRIRLYTFICACLLCIIAFSFMPFWVGIVSIIISLAVLLFVIIRHQQVDRISNHLNTKIKIYRNELHPKEENLFGNGAHYLDDKHAYSSDLDLFGDASVFSYINRTVTYEGSNLLADFLIKPADFNNIHQRQAITTELSGKESFKEQFLLTFFLSNTSSKEESERVYTFINTFQPSLVKKKFNKIITHVLPPVFILSLIAANWFSFLWAFSLASFLLSFFIILKSNKKVTEIDYYVGSNMHVFHKYSQLMKIIKDESFNNTALVHIQSKIVQEYQFIHELEKLSNLSKKLEFRHNVFVALFLNTFFLWDLCYALAIEKWFIRNSKTFASCLYQIGLMDAYLSMGICRFNHPSWVVPEITDDYFHLYTTDIAHPLIHEEKRVSNSYTLKGSSKVDIITGSNMAGKSTFLRTLGVNMVLAFAGMPVCAKTFSVSLVDIFTYMRIRDSLNENTSSFYAELLRIKSIIEEIQHNKRCFLLLDELLRGTNSKDKYIGSVAIVKNFIKNETAALIATHDLELTKMETDYPDNISNYHFDISVKVEEFFFDYTLRKGICHNFNACLLMKKIGIEIENNE